MKWNRKNSTISVRCWMLEGCGLLGWNNIPPKGKKKEKKKRGQVRPGQVSYLLLNVLERVRRVDGKADQDNMRVGVGQRAETVIVLLAYLQYKIKMSVNLVVDLVELWSYVALCRIVSSPYRIESVSVSVSVSVKTKAYQRYPTRPARRACHRPRHRWHSSQRRWGRKSIPKTQAYIC